MRLLQELADNLAFGITTIRERQRARDEVLQLNAGLEQRVQQRTVQLEAANQELEAFSYSVAHDLRAPLAAIDGFSAALERHGLDSERSAHYLGRVRASVQKMGEMIDALLTLARLSRAFDHLLSDLREKSDIEGYVTNLSRFLPEPSNEKKTHGGESRTVPAAPSTRAPDLATRVVLGIDCRALAKPVGRDQAERLGNGTLTS